MKQPELGINISEARKTKGFTQSELAEECNVDIRTIQRIETGEVTPRLFTLRIINEKLGTNFDLNGDAENKKIDGSKSAVRAGWIFGIVLFCLLPVMVLEAYNILLKNFEGAWPVFPFLIYTSIHILCVVFFYRALFLVGRYGNNIILKAGAVITIIVVVFGSISKVFGFFIDLPAHHYINVIYGVLIGISTILTGVGFVLIRKFQPTLAIVIGVVQMVAGVFYVFAGIIGIIMGGVSLILQIIYLALLEKEIKTVS